MEPLGFSPRAAVAAFVVPVVTLLFIAAQLAYVAGALLAIAIVWTIDAHQARRFDVREN